MSTGMRPQMSQCGATRGMGAAPAQARTCDREVCEAVVRGVQHRDARHAHLVGRQRASLVAADDRRAAQRLHRWQAAHKSLSLMPYGL